MRYTGGQQPASAGGERHKEEQCDEQFGKGEDQQGREGGAGEAAPGAGGAEEAEGGQQQCVQQQGAGQHDEDVDEL